MTDDQDRHYLTTTKQNNKGDTLYSLNISEETNHPRGKNDLAIAQGSSGRTFGSSETYDQRNVQISYYSGPNTGVDPKRQFLHDFSFDETRGSGRTNAHIEGSVADRKSNQQVVYNLDVKDNAVSATVEINGQTSAISPQGAAIGIRKRLETLLDHNELMRGQLQKEGFTLPKTLTDLLPEGMRDLRDLPNGYGDVPNHGGVPKAAGLKVQTPN